jgi:cation:H+ antiporter
MIKGRINYFSSLINLRLFNILFVNIINPLNSILVIILSIILIGGSCWFLIGAVEEISIYYEINLFITAFFIAAISSSIPDTILSIKDAKHNKFIDSFSNSYGSNIFDICIGIGLPVLIYSIIYKPIEVNIPIDRLGLFNLGDYIFNGNLLIWSLFILFIFTILTSIIYYSGKINFKNSILILLVYLSFIIGLIAF